MNHFLKAVLLKVCQWWYNFTGSSIARNIFEQVIYIEFYSTTIKLLDWFGIDPEELYIELFMDSTNQELYYSASCHYDGIIIGFGEIAIHPKPIMAVRGKLAHELAHFKLNHCLYKSHKKLEMEADALGAWALAGCGYDIMTGMKALLAETKWLDISLDFKDKFYPSMRERYNAIKSLKKYLITLGDKKG